MNPQTPAEGVSIVNDWGDSKQYRIQCECGSEDCSHYVEVEIDACGIQVHLHSTHHTKWWELSRWKQIWEIITNGHAKMQTTIVLSEQTALNYSAVLAQAIQDLDELRSKQSK